jgi:hypothetical protein
MIGSFKEVPLLIPQYSRGIGKVQERSHSSYIVYLPFMGGIKGRLWRVV